MRKKTILLGLVGLMVVLAAFPLMGQAQASTANRGTVTHTVQRGDTLWKLSLQYGVTVDGIKAINGLNSDTIYVGQKLKISLPYTIHTVQRGDTPWKLSRTYGVSLDDLLRINGLSMNSIIYVGQQLKIPAQSSNQTQPSRGGEREPVNTVTNKTHTVQRGDTLWGISIRYGIPYSELLKANNLSESSIIYPGQQLKVPVHNIAIKQPIAPQFGVALDWWTEAQYVWPIGTDATIIDYYTGRSWRMRRSYGANHADVEPVTAADTAIMREVWGGSWSWNVRPVIVVVNGHRIAASANGMPHSIQKITNNNYNGHSCIHFLNSTRHKDGQLDVRHQEAVRIAAGMR